MAYIPDIAIQRQYKELTPVAAALFNYYCLKRNAKQGGWNCPKETVLRELFGMCEPSYFRAKKELISKGWISAEKDFIRPLLGFETINNDSAEASATIKNDSLGETETIKIESETIKNDSPTIKNDSDIYKEDTNSFNQPINQKNVPSGTPSETSSDHSEKAKIVFAHWQTVLNHPKAKFSRDKKRKIVARLNEDFTVDDLKNAVFGCKASAYHQGENRDNRVYDSIDLIFRNAEKVEMFIGIYEASETRKALPAQAPTFTRQSLDEQEAEILAQMRLNQLKRQQGAAANV